MSFRNALTVAVFLIEIAAVPGALAGDDSGQVKAEFFERDVRPLLVERCFKCHGDLGKPKGGLRLTTRGSVVSGGDSGPAAVPGKPEESLLIQAIRYQDEPKMPPKEKLSEGEIQILTRWVEAGLPWPDAKPDRVSSKSVPYRFTDDQRRFWSFQPIRDFEPPAVRNAAWPKTPIDRFILASLEAKGLKPAPAADKRTLIRRATFDLTGLPPSPEEIDAFVTDDSSQAFARVVERLLASPRYGERWGRHWLDVVRYADSRDARGVGSADDITEAWRYRDWVVNALNRDLPYDQFIIDQVAGDLIPAESADQVNAEGMVATGLLTIGEWGTGDADKEKMLTDIVDDQIDVVGRAFMGLTIACARCHDHKFDPIPQADYYGLAGIFFSTHILPEPGAKTAGSPMLRTPIASKRTVESANRYKERVAELDGRLKRESASAYSEFARSQLVDTGKYLIAAWDYEHPSKSEDPPSLRDFAESRDLHPGVLRRWHRELGYGEAGRLLAQTAENVGGTKGVFAWRRDPGGPSLTVNTTDKDLAILTFRLPARTVSVHPGPASAVAVSWTSPVTGQVRVSGRVADGDPVAGDGVSWAVTLRQHQASVPLAEGDITNGSAQQLAQGHGAEKLNSIEVNEGDTVQLAIGPKEQYTCDTTTIELRIAQQSGPTWDLTQDLLPNPLAGNPHADRFGHGSVWRFSEVDDQTLLLAGTENPGSVAASWQTAVRSGDRIKVAKAAAAIGVLVQEAKAEGPDGRLVSGLLSSKGPFYPESIDELAPVLRDRLGKIRDELALLRSKPPPPLPLALVAQEGGVPKSAHEGIHDARIHTRGSYQRLGEQVPRHFPRIIAGDEPPSIERGSGRLELAQWLARANHPLTARVMVNRIWQYHFGEGIVRTPSDYGKLGERPSHPELLDYLAREFIASGWSIKAMHRAIMLSSVYQQASTVCPDALRLDPDNRLMGRMNRRRLESEAIRDSLLAAAGSLDLTMGGPSIRDFSVPRRTIYIMTIRSDRSSFGPMFDAADSTAIVDHRTISTVAPQALFLLNNRFAVSAARSLARRVQQSSKSSDEGGIRWLYALLYGRDAMDDELQIGQETLRLATLGEENRRDLAWDAYCQVLVCANEFLFVD
jgi:hypothetical protein